MLLSTFLLVGSCAFLAANALTEPTPTPSTNTDVSLLESNTATIMPTSSAEPTGYFLGTQYVTIAGATDAHLTRAPVTVTMLVPTCIQTISPGPNGYLPPGTCNSNWEYFPNFPAALACTFAFAALTVLHVWQAVRYKKLFSWLIIMGGTWETLAFAFRTASTLNQQIRGLYITFQIFILLAPFWVNAFNYLVLARMVYFFTPSQTLASLSAFKLAVIFMTLEFVSFVVQVVGASGAGPAVPDEVRMQGFVEYMGGIGTQLGIIVVFLVLAVRFQIVMKSLETLSGKNPGDKPDWRRLLYTLYASVGLVVIRILFRLVEFSGGASPNNPVLTSEALFYALEAVPMFLAIILYNLTHPGKILAGPDSEMPGPIDVIKTCWYRRKSKQALPTNDIDGKSFDGAEWSKIRYR